MFKSIKLTLITALFMAMTTVTILFLRIPFANGIIHIGDTLIYLAACILPFPYGLIAAGIGGAMANMLGGHIVWAPFTLVIKALLTLPYSSKNERILTTRNALMVFPAGLITMAGYFIAGWLLFDMAGAVTGLFGDFIQAAGSAVLFIIIAAALDKVKFKQKVMSINFVTN
jgi:uncharacterized repeat protein (TIGR04002 family)